ncbi:hypothetical protein AKJ47_02825 [candidate division MSBL1 archaeon SCGC-AAA261G05]|uniref:Cas12f1-like TNB domain-containing protein n=1 Tax=candidate division MSBL1 archaeon SCGC-AAA261G05 TaxID=1698276 RepID=A0A133V9K9_9EURY|nr:hypothetical protein AKJ47_02825 [candidate division MSBL1 archaeon SCGC-AAA261G05]
MARNHKLSRKILDASWRKFFHMLSYKAERAGRRVVGVNPRDTSEGLSWDDPMRDYISAKRILNRALSGLGQPAEPVEERPLLHISAHAVVVGHVFSVKQDFSGVRQEPPCESKG